MSKSAWSLNKEYSVGISALFVLILLTLWFVQQDWEGGITLLQAMPNLFRPDLLT